MIMKPRCGNSDEHLDEDFQIQRDNQNSENEINFKKIKLSREHEKFYERGVGKTSKFKTASVRKRRSLQYAKENEKYMFNNYERDKSNKNIEPGGKEINFSKDKHYDPKSGLSSLWGVTKDNYKLLNAPLEQKSNISKNNQSKQLWPNMCQEDLSHIQVFLKLLFFNLIFFI